MKLTTLINSALIIASITLIPGIAGAQTANNNNIDVHPKDLWSILSDNRVWDINANGLGEDNKQRYGSGLASKNFNFQHGSLIGTLDDGKTYFPVGTHLKLTVLIPGTLKLVHWDQDYTNNNGSVRAFVNVERK
ncbi:MAG: hypothetical protein KME52_13755 [Desmonostoc geniculatum HA4340-LM1]|jgi:hypothetical protein|nr:hypothetical protein [Desmonostoc geniculatum HA4340-LM1]